MLRLQRAQNACVRFTCNVSRFQHITPFYSQLNILKLEMRRMMLVAVLIWKIIKYKTPAYLFDHFHYFSDTTRSLPTRSNDQNLRIPKHRTTIFSQPFTVEACRVWNQLKLYEFLHLSA